MTAGQPIEVLEPDDLLRLIRRGDPEVATAVASMLARPVRMRSEVDRYLGDVGATKRLLGLVRAVIELAWATDPERALGLARPLRALIDGALADEFGRMPDLARNVREALWSATAFAALQTGDFDDCLRLTRGLLATSPSDETRGPVGWATDTRYEALIRTFRIAEARELRSRQPQGGGDPLRRIEELDDMLDGLVPAEAEHLLLKPRPTFDWFEVTRERLAAWLVRQREADRSLFDSFEAIGLDAQDRYPLMELFDRARLAVDAVEAVIDDRLLPKADRDDVIQRGFYAHSSAVRAIQSPSSGRSRTLHDNRHLLNYAAMVVALKAPTAKEAYEAVRQAESASMWSASVGDRYGEAMALWALGSLHERAGRENEALKAFSSLFALLVVLRADLVGAAARATLAGTFRTLIPRLTLLALKGGNQELAFEALEFRRGLAFSDIAEPGRRDETPAARPTYFAASVLDEFGVFVSLATVDGVRTVEQVTLTSAELDRLVARCRPDSWRPGVMRRDHSPRAALSALLDPLARAASGGRIADGSHICVALDHPLHAVPIQYLMVGTRMAGAHYGLSRVASLPDSEQLTWASTERPRRATTVFIPTRDVADHSPHEASFALATAEILAHVQVVGGLSGANADKSSILAAAMADGMIHIHAHGVFPDVYPSVVIDPVFQAGLLVARKGVLPDRSDTAGHVLSTGDILAASKLGAEHVSLSTCVSGLGRPGQGGDMLGVEFALRRCGVASVIACHWEVTHTTASAFFMRFYKEWLGNGLGRGEACRRAFVSLIEEAASEEEAAASVGAFSLFGAWS